ASMLTLHRRLLRLRRAAPALVTGAYEPVEADGDVLAYLRAGDRDRYLVALNLGPDPARLAVPGPVAGGRALVSTHPGRDAQAGGGPPALRGGGGAGGAGKR